MMRIIENHLGPLNVTSSTVVSGEVVGKVTVRAGGKLKITGTVKGDVVVEQQGVLVLLGNVKGTVVNEGGAVDIFGFTGAVQDVGDARSYVSRGAIIGGKRASKPGRLPSERAMLLTQGKQQDIGSSN
ncbi:MAG TPA: hypothetical protein VGD10_05490 [Allosphingosinicella sp.]|uniref:hypothetical protein n=1 Tax=Allosphingosinicella sp. TaxID=2823234 RepID=UPI002EDBAFB0